MEMAKYGEIEEMNVCDNVGDHLVGIILEFWRIDVYVRFAYEDDAGKANQGLNTRFYAGRPLYTELSPVTDFGEGIWTSNQDAKLCLVVISGYLCAYLRPKLLL